MKRNLLSKVLRPFLWFIVFIGGTYLIGPRVASPSLDDNLPEVPSDLDELNQWIDTKENDNTKIKPGNASHIVFNDSLPKKTKYSVLYLHGFSASLGEGIPVHQNIASALEANLYLPRLFEHGLNQEENLLNFTAEGYWESAKEALAVAKQLGEKVIVLATSSGATLALNFGNDPDIAAMVLYSPNVAIYNPASNLLSKPWGLTIARLVYGGKYHHVKGANEEKKKYWTTKYRLEALTQLQKLIDVTMTEKTFKKIKVPIYMGYFYKNDRIQDKVVSVKAMLKMYDQLGTPKAFKAKKAFPDGVHEITSNMSSNVTDAVTKESLTFLNKFLK